MNETSKPIVEDSLSDAPIEESKKCDTLTEVLPESNEVPLLG
jgi:hypothetical protein